MTNPMTEYAAMFKAEIESGRAPLPDGAREGSWAIGESILVNRDSISEGFFNPDLPQWFPARICMPPAEPENWYRWYNPYIWFETEIDLSAGGRWCTAKRNMSYVEKLAGPDRWAIPLSELIQGGKND